MCWASAVVQHFIMDGVLQPIDKAVAIVEDDCNNGKYAD